MVLLFISELTTRLHDRPLPTSPIWPCSCSVSRLHSYSCSTILVFFYEVQVMPKKVSKSVPSTFSFVDGGFAYIGARLL